MRRRFVVSLVSAGVLAVGLPVLGAAPAGAIQAPNTFSAAASATYQTNGIAWAVTSAQGKVFVGGTFSSVRPAGAAAGTGEVARTNFVVLDAATGAPTSCAPVFDMASSPGTGTVRALDVSPDGRTLYVGGAFSTAGGLAKQYLAALDIANCTVVSSFTPLPNATVRAIESTSTTVYYGGDITSVGGTLRGFIAAASAVGQPDSGTLKTWAPNLGANVRALALKPDGTALVVGGNFDTVDGVTSNRLVVLDAATGATLKTFTGFNTVGSAVKSIAVDATGFYLGNEGTGSGSFDGRTAYNWDYTRRWQDTCLGATQSVVVYQGLLYSGSHAHDCATMNEYPDGVRQHLLVQGVNDPTLLSWFPQTNDGLGESIGPRGLNVAIDGAGKPWMYVVGEFTTVNGVSQTGITRFGTGPDTSAPTIPVLSVTSFEPGKVRVAFRPSNNLDDTTMTYQIFRDGGATPIWSGAVTAFFWNRQQQTFVDTGLAFGSTHSYKVTVSDGTLSATSLTKTVTVASTASTYATRVLQDNPTMLLRYDEASDVLLSDSSPNSNNVVLSGAATFAQPSGLVGESSKSITLNGTSTYLYGQTRFGQQQAYSLETWFKTTSTVGGKIIGLGNRQVLPSTAYDKHVYMTSNGRLVFGVYTGSTQTVTSPASYNDGAWHLLTATQGSAGMALYVDGQLVGTNATKSNQGYYGYWHVGGDSLGSWPLAPASNYWQGSLDETAVYPTALSSSSVAAHYQAGTGTLPSTDVTAPTQPTGLSASYANGGVQLAWSAATDDVGVMGYDVYRSTTSGFAPSGAPLVSVSSLGWTDTTAPAGTNYYLVVARDASGKSSPPSAQAAVAVPVSATTVSLVASADTYVTSSAASTNYGTSTTLVSRGNAAAVSFLRFAVPATPAGAVLTGASLSWRTTTDVNAGSVDPHSITVGSDAWTETGLTWSTRPATGTVLLGTTTAPTALSTAYSTALDRSALAAAVPSGGGNLTINITNAGTDGIFFWSREVATTANRPTLVLTYGPSGSTDSVPPTQPGPLSATAASPNVNLSWGASTDAVGPVVYEVHRSSTSGFTPSVSTRLQVTSATAFTDTTAPVGTSYYVVVAVDGAGNRSTASGEASATTTDVSGPSAPTALVATPSGTNVSLTWTASTDNVTVAGYQVHRSSISGFTPSGATLLGTTPTSGWSDSGVPVGTWYYRVVAVDAVGNASAASSQASATVTGSTGTPTVVSLTPTADTYANAGAPSSNFGTSATLASRGSIGAVSYLRFVVPAAPAGKTLTAATLTFRTTNDVNAGSLETHTIAVASNTWDELTLTWNNRPAITGPVAGTIAAGTVPNAAYTTTLDPSALAALVGTTATLSVTNTGTDSLYFWSSNYTGTTARPTLTLTFS